MRRPDGITFLALWHFFLALSTFLGLLVLVGISGIVGLVAIADEEIWVGALELGVFGGLAAFLFLLALGFLVVGVGLWRMRPWSRVPALVIAAVSLVKFPVGTVVGGLTLWYLLREEGGGLALKPDLRA